MLISSITPIRFSVLIIMFFLCSCSGQPAAEKQFGQDLLQQNTALQQEVNQLKLQLDSLQNQSSASASGISLISETDINYLKKKGLQNPVRQIKLDLLRNHQLIPEKGTLGGTMRFYEERIYVLNRKWVLAYFEDGHIAGQMLLEYQVGNGGNLSWQVVTSSLM